MIQVPTEKEILLDILKDQLRRYSKYAVQDIYKLLYQSAMGNKHLLADQKRAREILKEEWKELNKVKPYESLLEIIDPAGVLMRVNLRVYKKTGGQIEKLFEIMKDSAGQFQENPERLKKYWAFAGELADAGKIPFQNSDLLSFWRGIEERGFPEISHSEKYEETHEPAYRVVMKSLWEGFKPEK